ncbi:hypothetical protein BGZ72_006155 [Mortierella alpina]|nr:hypothetical protein BGZ72_006155 [Mortierella alpina]
MDPQAVHLPRPQCFCGLTATAIYPDPEDDHPAPGRDTSAGATSAIYASYANYASAADIQPTARGDTVWAGTRAGSGWPIPSSPTAGSRRKRSQAQNSQPLSVLLRANWVYECHFTPKQEGMVAPDLCTDCRDEPVIDTATATVDTAETDEPLDEQAVPAADYRNDGWDAARTGTLYHYYNPENVDTTLRPTSHGTPSGWDKAEGTREDSSKGKYVDREPKHDPWNHASSRSLDAEVRLPSMNPALSSLPTQPSLPASELGPFPKSTLPKESVTPTHPVPSTAKAHSGQNVLVCGFHMHALEWHCMQPLAQQEVLTLAQRANCPVFNLSITRWLNQGINHLPMEPFTPVNCFCGDAMIVTTEFRHLEAKEERYDLACPNRSRFLARPEPILTPQDEARDGHEDTLTQRIGMQASMEKDNGNAGQQVQPKPGCSRGWGQKPALKKKTHRHLFDHSLQEPPKPRNLKLVAFCDWTEDHEPPVHLQSGGDSDEDEGLSLLDWSNEVIAERFLDDDNFDVWDEQCLRRLDAVGFSELPKSLLDFASEEALADAYDYAESLALTYQDEIDHFQARIQELTADLEEEKVAHAVEVKAVNEMEANSLVMPRVKCRICYENTITHAIIPCYHLITCGECATKIVCPRNSLYLFTMEPAPTRHSSRLANKEKLKAREAENPTARVLLNTFTASSPKAPRAPRPHHSKSRSNTNSKSKSNSNSKEEDVTTAPATTRQGKASKKPKTPNTPPPPPTKANATAQQARKAAKASKKRPLSEDKNDTEDASPQKKRRRKPKKADSSEAHPMDVDQPQQQEQKQALALPRVPPRPINPTDPCERLPTEVWHHVLAQLPLSQAATTSRVSKTWLDGALSWPKWRHICEDLSLGTPKRKFKTYMSIVCLHSYFICDLCFSYSTGFRKSYGSQIPLPVDIVVKRLDWDKQVEKAEKAEKAEGAESALQQTDVLPQGVSDAERTEQTALSQPTAPEQHIPPTPLDQPLPMEQTEAASSSQPPPPVQQTEPTPTSLSSSGLPPPPAQLQQQHLADSRHTQPEQASPPESQPEHVSQLEQARQLLIPTGVLDAGVAEQMKQAISQLIKAAKLSQELAADFRAQVKACPVQPVKNPSTAPQANATANKKTDVAQTQNKAAPAAPAKPPQPTERWNLCHPCRLQHYRTHPQPTQAVYDMYSQRTTNGQRRKLKRMCKTRALCKYGLSASDIRDLEYIERRNPHHGSWNPMMLYSIRDLQKRALTVHGGWVGVNAFKNSVNKKRRTAFNARLELWKIPSRSKKTTADGPKVDEKDDTSAVDYVPASVLA